MSRGVSEDKKMRFIREYQNGAKCDEISKEYNISKSTLYYWIAKYKAKGNNESPRVLKENYALKRHVKKLEGLLEVFRKAGCAPSAPLKVKLAALEKLYGQYSVHTLCDALEVPRGTFYNHMLRNQKENAERIKHRQRIMQNIKEVSDESHQMFGAGKIRAVLVARGDHVSEKYVSQLMREMGIYSLRDRTKKDRLSHGWDHRKANLLKREFDVVEPDMAWVSDVTCFNFKNRYFYICVFLDLYSRKAISFSIGYNNSTNLVRRAFMSALSLRKATRVILHTDRGTPYTSFTMRKIAKQNDVVLSYSRPRTPHDNAVMESFFASMKKEELYRVGYRSEKELRQSIGKYIAFYNAERPHEHLDYGTPEEFETSFWNIPKA